VNETPSAPDAGSAGERTRITFRQDRIRGACAGLLETGTGTFGLVVAIRYFDAGQSIKALVSSAGALGLLLTPLSLFLFARRGWTASRGAAAVFAGGAVFLVIAALAPSLAVFAPAFVAGAMLLAQQSPLLVHIYTTNYPPGCRGRLLSNSIVLSLIGSVAFAMAGGRLLDHDMGAFRGLMLFMAAAALAASRAVAAMPAEPFAPERTNNPLRALRYAWQDRTFGAMLVVWMLMGLGNLMMLPLRVDYMANPAYGIDAANAQIAAVIAVVPSLVRIATTHLWGMLFDRYNFFVIRTVLNGFFLAGILLFFSTKHLAVLWIAAGLFGMAMAGGNIAWNLWVTKFAPPERTADYMSVHTFLTGVRGVAAPFLGFQAVARMAPFTTACIAAALIALSMLLLDPLRRRHAASGRS
jgi:MFS family permease